VGANLTSAGTVVALALNGFGVWSLIGGYIATNVVSTVPFVGSFRRIPKPGFSLSSIAALLGFSLKITVNSLLSFVYMRADVFIIGKVLGERALGYYSMAFHLATLPLDKVGTVFNNVAFPAMARLQSQLAQSQSLFLDMHRYLLTIAYPLLLGLALVADDLVVLLLTQKWKPIVLILQTLCVVNLLRVSGMLFAPVLHARGRADLVLRYVIVSALVLPASMLVGVRFGLTGVLAAWAIAYPVIYLYCLFLCLRDLKLPIHQFLHSIKAVLIVSTTMVAVVLAVKSLAVDLHVAARLSVAILAGATTYLAVFLLFYKEQIAEVRSGIASIRRGRIRTVENGIHL
jgi:O-antigen/teichoic acid export membrane protein